MADKKISELPKINLISGSEVILPIVHDGTTQKMDVSTFAVFASQWSADTGSNTFIGNQIISGNLSVSGLSTLTGNTSIGGNLVVNGKLTAQELFTEITSASIIFESGSTIFGNSADDTHTITGTLILNGLAIDTAQLMAQTASQDGVNLRISSTTGSINTTTSSFDSVFLGISSVTGAINTTTSSFDSVFLGISSFTGSLNSLTGSYATTGSNTFYGNQSITGSLSVSAGEFNVTTGSLALTSSLRFDHTQNDGATLQLSHDNNTALADHAFNVTVKSAGVYTSFVQNGTPYSILNVEAFDNNNIYLYRDTRLYNKSLFIDNNLTVENDVVIGTGSLSIERGQFSVTSGSGELTSSLAFTHNTISSTQGYSLFTLRHINNDFNENFALKLFADDYIAKIQYEQNSVTYDILRTNLAGDVHLTQDTRVFGKGLTVDDSLLVKGVITGSILSTNGVVSSSNQLFELNGQTGSQNNINFNISVVTSSIDAHILGISIYTASANTTNNSVDAHILAQSIQTASQDLINYNISVVTSSIDAHILKQSTQTGSQDLVNLGISSVTGSLIGITNGLMAFTAALDNTYATDAQLLPLIQATASLNTQTGSQDLVNLGISTYTGSQNVINTSVDSHILTQATQTGSQDLVNLGISSVTGSLIGITNGLMAFTAALDSTYATDAQLYQLYQATHSIELTTGSLIGITNGLMAFTAALDSTYATDAQLLPILQATQSLELLSGSLIGITNGLMAFTAALDSTYATDAQLYQLYAETASIKAEIAGIEALTASFKAAAIVSSSTQVQNYDVFALNSNLYESTGSIKAEIAGIEAYTASLKGAAIVSSSQQITNYYKFAETASANTTFYGNVTASGNLTAAKVAIGSTVTPTIPLEVYGQQKWFTTTGDGSELRGLFNPGGAADDSQLTLYKADGTTAGITLTPDGINFSANANATGMTSELLNDYEEGTFTPVIAGGTSAGTATYTDQNGKYTKIGNCVYFRTDVIWSGHTGTGTLKITGLPFTIGQNYQSVGSVRFNQSGSANHYIGGGYIYQTQFELNQTPVGGGSPASFDITSAGDIRVSGHYFV